MFLSNLTQCDKKYRIEIIGHCVLLYASKIQCSGSLNYSYLSTLYLYLRCWVCFAQIFLVPDQGYLIQMVKGKFFLSCVVTFSNFACHI